MKPNVRISSRITKIIYFWDTPGLNWDSGWCWDVGLEKLNIFTKIKTIIPKGKRKSLSPSLRIK